MKQSTLTRIIAPVGTIASVIFLAFAAGSCVYSEIRWAKINSPVGKFTNVTEYVAHGRQPSRVTSVEKKGKTYFIAHGPLDTWLATPSGPAAYVFDESGRMVHWSPDTGDDPSFWRQWPRPHTESSFEELKELAQEGGSEAEPVAGAP
jgi:hypothetical protein